MNDEQMMVLIESLGDDAKGVFIAYLVLDYGSLWVMLALGMWGIRTLWKKRDECLL